MAPYSYLFSGYTPFSGWLWGVDSLAFDLHGGSTYLFFRPGLFGLSFQGSVCVCMCVEECLAVCFPWLDPYLPTSCGWCDLIHLSSDLSFRKCFTSVLSCDTSPSIHPVGPLLLLSSHFAVENIEAQRGCPRSHNGRIRILETQILDQVLPPAPYLSLGISSWPGIQRRRSWGEI